MRKTYSGGLVLLLFVLGFVTVVPGLTESRSKKSQPAPQGSPALPPVTGQLLAPAAATAACSAWQDSFSRERLDTNRWVVANGQAPGAIANLHYGDYLPGNVSTRNGMLSMTLTQQLGKVGTNQSGVISHGALIYTKTTCGYGTYQWRMRMSSSGNCSICAGAAYSGSVSAGFLYVNNSQTEIDFEFTATTPQSMWLVNWLNPNPATDPTPANEQYDQASLPSVTDKFHDYKFVWAPGIITYYIDGVLTATHTTNVPSAPAYFMINHWGTDNQYWGGYASLGTPRYSYVDRVSYTP